MSRVFRIIKREPWIAAIVVATLSIAIGTTSAAFGVVDGLLARPLPYATGDRLVEIWERQPQTGRESASLSPVTIQALRQGDQLFSKVEAYRMAGGTLTGDGEPESVSAPNISVGLLGMLGVKPREGRLPAIEEVTSAQRVAFISERLQRRRYGNTNMIGRQVVIDDEPHTIIGVLPGTFSFPVAGADVWRVFSVNASLRGRFRTVASLRPGITREAANQRLAAIAPGLSQAGVLPRGQSLELREPIQMTAVRRYQRAFYLICCAAGLVLLIACLNVVNLLLIRVSERQPDFALMTALGATRSHVIGDAVRDGLALAVFGGLGGIAVAEVCLAVIPRIVPKEMIWMGVPLTEWRLALFAACLSVAICVAVCLVPALWAHKIPPADALNTRVIGRAPRRRWQAVLISGQLAITLLLLTGGGLLLRSFVRLVTVDLGFNPDNLVVVDIQLPARRYASPGSGRAFFEQLAQLTKDSGLAQSVAFADGAPPTGGGFFYDIQPEAYGGKVLDGSGLKLPYANVSPEYFATMGIRLVAGRRFLPSDPDDVVIVNEIVAKRIWGSQSPLGHRFRPSPDEPWSTVVGVASDVKQTGPDDSMGDGMEVYFPYPKNKGAGSSGLIVRAAGNQSAVIQHVKKLIWSLDSRVPVIASSIEQRIGATTARARFLLILAAFFAALSAFLSIMGVYGTAAYWVMRRRRELAIRVALGAKPWTIGWLVIRRGLAVAVVGVALGVSLSMAASRVLDPLLFAAAQTDIAAFAAAAVLLIAIVVVACALPARRASRIAPWNELNTQ